MSEIPTQFPQDNSIEAQQPAAQNLAAPGQYIEYEGDQFFGQVTDQMRIAMEARGCEVFESQFESLAQTILNDPYGETSIDAFKDTEAGQYARVVHEVTGDLANLIPGKKLAIKGSGMDMNYARNYLELGGPRRSMLTRQFEVTNKLAAKQQLKAPDGAGGLLRINEVYGVFVSRDKEPGRPARQWMLMEMIEDAQPVESVSVARSRGGVAPGFDPAKYPELAAYAKSPRPAGSSLILFKDVAEKMNNELGIWSRESPLGDLNGNNILEQKTPDGPKYTVIDVQSV